MKVLGSVVAIATLVLQVSAQADDKVQIYTGGKAGSYYSTLAPLLKNSLDKDFIESVVIESKGSAENIDKVLENPKAIGMTQYDVFAAIAAAKPEVLEKLEVIRSDFANECLFAVVKKDMVARLPNWAAVNRLAGRMKIATGPVGSGAAATIDYLRAMDVEQKTLARATVLNLKSVDDAITAVQNGGAHVAFFVQYADPTSARFKAINDNGMAMIPVISKEIVQAQVGGKEVYSVFNVEVTEGGIFSSGTKLDTACTAVTYITGKPTVFTNGGERRNQDELLANVRRAPSEALVPQDGFWAKLKKSAIKKSGQALNAVLNDIEAAANAAKERFN